MAKAMFKPRPVAPFMPNSVLNMDCLDMMASIRGNSVDMVFADPPFNLGKKYNSYDDSMPLDEYLEWTDKWLGEAMRILKPTGSIFVYNIPRLLVRTTPLLLKRAHFRHWIAWNSNGQPLGKTLQPAHYGILFFSKSKNSKFFDVRAPHKICRKCKTYLKDYGGKSHLRHNFGPLISDVWDDIHRIRHNIRRIEGHPCQLPVPLIERMILMTTDPDDYVVDLFCGGGSAGVAAIQMGRKYLGAEIDQIYSKMSAKKIQEAKPVKQNGEFVSVYLKKIYSVRDTYDPE